MATTLPRETLTLVPLFLLVLDRFCVWLVSNVGRVWLLETTFKLYYGTYYLLVATGLIRRFDHLKSLAWFANILTSYRIGCSIYGLSLSCLEFILLSGSIVFIDLYR